MGRLIVIEGLDGSGKTTQLELLKTRIADAHFITFPQYESHSGKIISEYLNGMFNEQDNKISAYSASIMYAVDRYTSYRTQWKAMYDSTKPVISARYVSSNVIYQMSKLEKSEWDSYLDWIYDLEYGKLGMPEPDLTIFLDMPTEISQKLLLERYGGDPSKKDIHERNTGYLKQCREAAMYAADKFGWYIIDCHTGDSPRTVADINRDIMNRLSSVLL